MDILKTIAFEEFHIKVISSGIYHEDNDGNSHDEMKAFMAKEGYKVHSLVTHKLKQNHANDYIFVKNDLL